MKKEPSARVRIGIAGAGIAGRRHGEAFARHPGAAVAAVADVDPDRGREAASRFGARCFADYREMLRAGIDAVVSLPHALHLACAEDAARAGIHILMEKPLATTLEDARAIVAAADRARVRLMLGYVHRFRPEVEAARRLIIEGRPPSASGEDGLRGLAAALAIYRSAASGRPERVLS